MLKKNFLKFVGMLLLAVGTLTSAQALSLSTYTTTSKLANGHWVKIQIPESGVYELTYDELRDMGFSNANNVRVYGCGGYMLSEVLDGSHPDDLVQVPVQRFADKMCFYAKGPVNFTFADLTSTSPHFTRTVNTYSKYGYYFLAENIGNELTVNVSSASPSTGTVGHESSYDYTYHERDLTSLTLSGKNFLGEAFPLPDNLTMPYTMPNWQPGTPVTVTTCVASSISSNTTGVTVSGYVKAYMNSDSELDTLKFSSSSSRIYSLSGQVKYNFATPTATINPKRQQDNGTIQFGVTCSSGTSGGTVTRAYLDYFILTYFRQNVIGDDGQFRMNFVKITPSDRVDLPNATNNLVVWNIDNEANPVQYNYSDYTDGESAPVKAFTPGYTKNWSQFVAFDPTMTLKKITAYENVENQNIHGLSNPNMVILTDKEYLEQAERLAQMHRDHDNCACGGTGSGVQRVLERYARCYGSAPDEQDVL